MGSSSYSYSVFTSSITDTLNTKGVGAVFAHDTAAHAGKVAALNPSLDPKLVAGPKSPHAGKVMRESRDSDAHPNSVAIVCAWDGTGSMAQLPKLFVEKLGSVMAGVVKKGYLADPQVMFAVVGDETCDRVPLQISQFESGNEADSALSKVFLEGGGGGQHFESYELLMYFLARHTSADCWEKRGKKGMLFILGDECPRDKVSKGAVNRVIGDDLEADIPLATILAELREKYEVWWLFPKGSGYWDQTLTSKPLSEMFGQSFIRVEDPSAIAELIVASVGIAEGYDSKDIVTDLVDLGFDPKAAKLATSALATYATSALTRKVGTVEGELSPDSSKDTVKRL